MIILWIALAVAVIVAVLLIMLELLELGNRVGDDQLDEQSAGQNSRPLGNVRRIVEPKEPKP